MKEECSLCGGVFSHFQLRRCYRCGRLYCRNCVMFTWNKNMLRNVPICLNCARRSVSPRKPRTKYGPLSEYLVRRARYGDFATLTFAKIESIIGANLPSSASQNTQWWNNAASRTQAQAWMNVGWRVHAANLNDRTVTFKRTGSPKKTRKKRRKRTRSPAKKFQPPKPQPFRRRGPSKTKIAKAWARLQNVERRRMSMRQYRGKFKPKPAFEKKLYKPEAKPDK